MTTTATPFRHGWRKLPDELKLTILRHVLPSGEEFGSLSFNKAEMYFECQLLFDCGEDSFPDASLPRFQTDVFPLLACPETRHLVPEAFYTQNTMRLHGSLYPRPSFWVFVRRVHLSLLDYPKDCARLEILANATSRVEHLHRIDLDIARGHSLGRMRRIEFNATQVNIKYTHWLVGKRVISEYDWVYDDSDTVYDGFDKVLLAKLTLAPKGGKVNKRIERYNYIKPRYVYRVTKKTAWRLA
jgi:hypothetical protein